MITGKDTNGTLYLTHDTPNGSGAALSSEVGDITITGGATVKVTFKKQSTPNVSGHAISVEKHDLIISGEGTTVEATNQSGAPQNFSNDATVMVEGGSLVVSDGAWLKATNEFTNTSKLYPPDFKNFSYYSSAISGDKNAPCTVSVTGVNSCIIASAYNSTKYDVNTSMGQAYRWANFDVDGAKIEVGNSAYPTTESTVDGIKGYRYVTISVAPPPPPPPPPPRGAPRPPTPPPHPPPPPPAPPPLVTHGQPIPPTTGTPAPLPTATASTPSKIKPPTPPATGSSIKNQTPPKRVPSIRNAPSANIKRRPKPSPPPAPAHMRTALGYLPMTEYIM